MGEKPLADTMERAREMVAASKESGRVFAVIQNRRYDREIRRVHRALADGILGRLTTLDSDFYVGAHFGGFRDRMRHVLLLDMAVHTFDQARYVSGADPVAVTEASMRGLRLVLKPNKKQLKARLAAAKKKGKKK